VNPESRGRGAPTAGSVVFDRAAGNYDRTRMLPEDTARAQTELLASELAAVPGRVLEIGVGTGRIAIPLAARGLDIIGVDLSAPMLAELVAKESPVVPVRASATQLPLRAQSVTAVIACHVLHLISDWRSAAAEAVRVLRPGGLLLVSRGRNSGPRGGPGQQLQGRLRASLAAVGGGSGGLESFAELDAFLAARGASARRLPEIPNPASRTAAEFLRSVGDNTYSWTWRVPPDQLRAAVAEALAWVSDAMGDPEQVEILASPVRWRAYRIPGPADGPPRS
jgi:SAM-dependent methyltransferase